MPAKKWDWSKLKVGGRRKIPARGKKPQERLRASLLSSLLCYRQRHDRRFRATTARTKAGIVVLRTR